MVAAGIGTAIAVNPYDDLPLKRFRIDDPRFAASSFLDRGTDTVYAIIWNPDDLPITHQNESMTVQSESLHDNFELVEIESSHETLLLVNNTYRLDTDSSASIMVVTTALHHLHDDQQAEIEALQEHNESLQADVDKLKKKISKLESVLDGK